MPDPIITENFAAAAADYDLHADVQAEAARKLLAVTASAAPRSILEPGCGTGAYTALLADAYRRAAVRATDVCERMLAVARRRIPSPRVQFAVEDAEKRPSGSYDLITSNATFQWFVDLAGTLRRMADSLNDDGMVSFSSFGPRTYCELDAALRAALGEGVRAEAARFPGNEQLSRMMAGNFSDWAVEEVRYSRHFQGLTDLLQCIHSTGTQGRPPARGGMWTPGMFQRVERAYPKRHAQIRATYQVFFCWGRR